jgi:hypothetical protein
MLPPVIKSDGECAPHRKRERGVTMALVALSIVAIISFAALAIDLGFLYEAKAEAQRSADAAALAAARVIAVSGVTGDPSNTNANWASVCGPSGTATLAATTVAQQNLVGGTPPLATVLYGANTGIPTQTDCTNAGAGFGINPVVSVKVQQANLPTFFARVFSLIPSGTFSNSGVSATAYAEAFNPSNSNGGSPIPVQPRCVKPWVIPNKDPKHPMGCNGSTIPCTSFVDLTTGQITTPGMFASAGVIGERFFLQPDCAAAGATCALVNNPPQATPPNLQYVPGQASSITPVALPTNGTTCSDVISSYAQDIAGCDQSTVYQCGVPLGSNNNYSVDLSENPAAGDTQNAVQCLIHQTLPTTASPSGQDVLAPGGPAPPTYPFQIFAGTSNPLTGAGLASGSIITNSSSIVSLPIYDQTNPVTLSTTGDTNVTVVGFLQVFINATTGGVVDVTVLNVSGCGNAVASSAPALYGTSSVPVRLITPP